MRPQSLINDSFSPVVPIVRPRLSRKNPDCSADQAGCAFLQQEEGNCSGRALGLFRRRSRYFVFWNCLLLAATGGMALLFMRQGLFQCWQLLQWGITFLDSHALSCLWPAGYQFFMLGVKYSSPKPPRITMPITNHFFI